jgi:NTP pyrophosphatase (non-canonical NTP hydrolase)
MQKATKVNKTDYDRILDYNEPQFNYYKLAEELAELSEVVLKRYGKKPDHKPSIEKLIEESGDVLVRLKILIRMEGIQKNVVARKRQKLNQLIGYIEKGKYKGGV